MEASKTARSPDKHYQARILDRRDISKDLWILRVDPGGPFEYCAGQYATLGMERDGVRTERAYSIVSSPYEDALEFFVELVPHGDLTPSLFELVPGDTLLCRKIAKGRFLLDLRSGHTNHLLISTTTGIAPFVSYVRTFHRDWKSGAVPLPGEHKLFSLQGSSHSFEFGYREELERYSSEAPWFKYVPTVSRPWDNAHWTGETGRADDLLRKYIEAWGLRPDTTTAYLCGHPKMIQNSRGILERAGWNQDAILEEAYYPVAAKEADGSG
ncbi:MAG TPA: FAD-binding oxidoreductase [Candidatus Dormibacteraeota bacterium]|nr:FAD-binding oxidoreductase [Candidatus Dormibacteraeota bacterium]